MDNTKQRYQELGNFLKTRRAKISPSQVGLPEGIRRRTPGLRREEVASLAGIGLTWYTWLEQGRQIHVSTQVLESLSRVLRLDSEEIKHLYTLAQQHIPSFFSSDLDTVNPSLQHVLDSLTLSPAIIIDVRYNIIAWNDAASVVLIKFSEVNLRSRNMLSLMFTNPTYQELFSDWKSHAKRMIGNFRAGYSKFIDDPWVTSFVKDLRNKSKEFDSWWPMYDIEEDKEINKIFNHPIVGQLIFDLTSFKVSSNLNLCMAIYTPMAETDTADKVKALLKANSGA